MELLPCSHLRSAKFSVALENETVPGIYHIYANLKESEYLPPRRYVLSAKLEFGFMFETRTGVIEFGAAQIKDTEKILFNAEVVVWNNDTTPVQGSHTTVIDITELPYQTKQSNLYELCSLHQLSTMRIYRDHQSLNPTECLIPEFTPRNLVAPSPEHNLTPQWLHIVGDSNSHMLFKHLTRHKLSLKQCWSGHYPSPVVCTFPFDGQAPAHGIHFVVYTNWFLDVDVLPFPKNAFHSWDLERFFQEYRHFLPQNEEDPESEYGILMARVKDTYPMPARTIVSFGSHWDHQTPYGMMKTMNAVVNQIENQKEREWYKKTARFVAETAVLTSQIPPKYVGRTYHQQNARIMERNNVVLDICRANGLQFIDQFGWGQAWGVWKEPGDAYHFKEDGWKNGMVYSRMADTYLMDMGFRV
ncbi:hypothetical protein HDU79_002647 [Rhizoclosmatium sp. JEL0117]|nr:hypothetical protein HDU79_002647 [Rhizoclosmatium sp. JEL0117]